LKGRVGRFLGPAQLSKPRHVLANIDGLLFGIRHGSHAFFGSQTLTIGARYGFR
jgi:hypothetical protein